ncbi:MAG: hypothetical protein PIR02_15990 [Microbacterium enclense]
MPEQGYVVEGSGVPGWGDIGAGDYEERPEFRWPKSIETADNMRRDDPQVRSVIRAVKLPILRATWNLNGAGCRDEVTDRVARNLGLKVKGSTELGVPRRRKGRTSWNEFLRHALLELDHGHSYFEQVYEQTLTGGTNLTKLAWRPPRTIEKIEVARDGGLVGVRQYGVKRRIDVDRLVAFVNEREGGNWAGESLLRPAYKMWLLKDRVLRIQALTAERNGLGMPIYTSPPPPANATYDQVIEWIDRELERGLTVAKNARAGESAGAGLPYQALFRFAGVEGDLPDTDKPIRYYDEQIARAVLAHFLNLGTETGSWALGSTFANFFTDSLNAVAQHIADVVQQHVIEDLVDKNWGEDEPAPLLEFEAIGANQPATAEAIRALVDAKIITPDEATETHVRTLLGFPLRKPGAPRDTPTEDDADIELEGAA